MLQLKGTGAVSLSLSLSLSLSISLSLRSPYDGELAKPYVDGRAAEPLDDVRLSSGRADASELPLSPEFENDFAASAGSD